MKVLVACEFSGVVRDAFKDKGHYCVSCDLEPTEVPGLHYKGDVRDIIGDGWDLMIAHPPCTHLSVAGAKWFKDKADLQVEALAFVQMLLDAPVDRIALENPIGIISTRIRKPDQIVQPYWFGDPYEKRTCLWLRGLPKLVPSNMVVPEARHVTKSGKSLPKWYNLPPSPNRGKLRSKTFPGFAKAMADQWG